jgi:tetratricopeptide (TPR) repeat protein
MRALATNAADRYQTVSEIQTDIQSYLDGFATEAEHAGFGTQLKLLVNRHRGIVASIGVALAVIAILVAGFVVKLKQGQSQAEEALAKADASLLEKNKAEEERSAQGRLSAPRFVALADEMIRVGKFESAIAAVQMAVNLDPQNSEAHFQYGRAQLAQGSPLLALESFKTARDLSDQESSIHSRCAPYVLIANRYHYAKEKAGGELSNDEKYAFGKELVDEGDQWLGSWIFADASKVDDAVVARLEAARETLGADNGVELKQSVIYREDGYVGFNLWGQKTVKDLSALSGLPITYLNLGASGVSDLSHIRDLPLRFLNIDYTTVDEFSALQGMRTLEHLHMLAMKTEIRDVSWMKGLQLTELILPQTKVSDLTPLAGMPLQSLVLRGCYQLKDISPLEGMPLENLNLKYLSLTEDQFEFLRAIETLERLNEKPAAQFWKEYDAAQAAKAKEGKK